MEESCSAISRTACKSYRVSRWRLGVSEQCKKTKAISPHPLGKLPLFECRHRTIDAEGNAATLAVVDLLARLIRVDRLAAVHSDSTYACHVNLGQPEVDIDCSAQGFSGLYDEMNGRCESAVRRTCAAATLLYCAVIVVRGPEPLCPVVIVMVKISEGTVIAATSWSVIHSRHADIPLANLHTSTPGQTHACKTTVIVSALGQKSCSVRLTNRDRARACPPGVLHSPRA